VAKRRGGSDGKKPSSNTREQYTEDIYGDRPAFAVSLIAVIEVYGN
jgi:hypothetical protein